MRTDEVPSITVAQMREIDRLMADELRITLEQMMENAGRALPSGEGARVPSR